MVSVVIPTYNAENYLPALILMLRKQTVSHELVILDSESTDSTRLILQQEGIDFVSVKKREFNHGATRNKGLQFCNYETVIFMTQDALPEASDTLEKLINSLYSETKVAVAYGRQIPYVSTDTFGRFARYNNYPSESLVKDKNLIPTMGIKTCSCSNSFAAYKKSLLLEIGGFPEDVILGEDVSVAAQYILQNYSVYYCAEAVVYHSHNYSLAEEFCRYFDIGVFHKQQQSILNSFTGAESEGLRYVLAESKFLLNTDAIRLIPEQYARTFVKYIGYRMGLFYINMPKKLLRRFSMHPLFWDNV